MVAIITGDIINSRSVSPSKWQKDLKSYLTKVLHDKSKWEIYRGDSFQLEAPVLDALEIVLTIKALVKRHPLIDVRMTLGVGEKSFQSKKIIESNGTAFIYSGESFENLKNNTLIIKTSDTHFDDFFNPILKLLSFICDSWKPMTANTLYIRFTHKDLKQYELAKILNKDISTVNKALKRGGYDQIEEVIAIYKHKVIP